MNQGKYVFAQITDFLPRRVFDRIVKEHNGNTYVRSFTCWNQMLCMVFGQLTSRDSMRDLILSLEAHYSKYYHLGFGTTVSRCNLVTINQRRSYKIFREFAYILISEARKSCYRDDFEIAKSGLIYDDGYRSVLLKKSSEFYLFFPQFFIELILIPRKLFFTPKNALF